MSWLESVPSYSLYGHLSPDLQRPMPSTVTQPLCAASFKRYPAETPGQDQKVGAAMYDRQELYIGGRWRAASGSNKIEVDEAATGRTFGSVPVASDDDLHEAVAAARGAFDGWSQTPVAERAGLLRAIASGLEAREDELATVMAR